MPDAKTRAFLKKPFKWEIPVAKPPPPETPEPPEQRFENPDITSSDWDDPLSWDLDTEVVQRALEQIRQRFIDERVKGFKHPESGQYFRPVSRREAEKRWNAVAPKFQAELSQYDQQANFRLGTHRYNPVAAISRHAMADEPSLRHGESLVARVCGKLLQS